MATEAGADIAYYAPEIKLEPVDVETDCKETQHIDCDSVVKEEIMEAYAGCGVTQEAADELYIDHVIKQEMAIGPVVLQQCLPSDADASKENILCKSEAFKSSTCAVMSQSEEKPLHKKPLHMRILEHSHAGDNSPQCEDLKEDLTIKSDFNQQKRTTRKKLFSAVYCCKICENQFLWKSNLTRHMRIHTREKPYCCAVCKKQYTQKITLPQHKQIHSGEKLFCSTICEKQLTWKVGLVQHKQSLAIKKPFSCKICEKQFSRKNSLTEHEQYVHTSEKLFHCKICKKRFARKSSLYQHKQIHTIEKIFFCVVCNEQFSCKSDLIRHRIFCGAAKMNSSLFVRFY